MDKKNRRLFILTFFISTIAVALLAAAFATDFWLEAHPKRNVDSGTEEGARNVTDGDLDTKFKGYIHFGLFHGYKSLDHGLGLREGEIWVTELVDDHGLFNFAMWVSTMVFAALAIVWGLVAMTFSIINASTRPIETITGPMGLYLWNGLAALFSLLSLVLYVVLFYQDLRKNVLTEEDRKVFLWTSENRANLAYSFYFVVVSTVLFALNNIVILISGTECLPINYGQNLNEKAMDGVMMY